MGQHHSRDDKCDVPVLFCSEGCVHKVRQGRSLRPGFEFRKVRPTVWYGQASKNVPQMSNVPDFLIRNLTRFTY